MKTVMGMNEEQKAKNRERVRRWRARHPQAAKEQSQGAKERYLERKRGRPRLPTKTAAMT